MTTLIVGLDQQSTFGEVVIIAVALLVVFHDRIVEHFHDFYWTVPGDPR